MDQHVVGHTRHLVLVASKDVATFRQFSGPKREIIDEADLLPSWLRRFSDPFSGFKRDIWLSPSTWPMRGWHVQQLRRFAIAEHIDEAAYVSVDSDVAFVAPYHVASNWNEGRLRLYRLDNALGAGDMAKQRDWSASAGSVLGLNATSKHDYINTLVAWRSDHARGALKRITQTKGRHWVSALGKFRTFSECMIYGRYADEVMAGSGHDHDAKAYCKVYWTGEALSKNALENFITERAPHQVAIGMQSFVGVSVDVLKSVLLKPRA
jgi:Family of unknown function (DUF6492)